jgi:two-component system, OmpR family, response regulator
MTPPATDSVVRQRGGPLLPVFAMNNGTPSLTSPGVLVVDDEEPIRNLLQLTLYRDGFRVLVAASGHEALLLAVASGQLHVAVVDRRMPDMSGEETAVALRRLSPRLPVLLIAGEPPVGGLPEGCTEFLQKPFALGNLVSRLRALLSRR